MSVFDILYTILIGPLQLFFEVIFMLTNHCINNPGLSIIVLSLVMNLLVLPLYRRADAMQEEERNTEERLQKGVAHIKKTFKGDERMMMLQTYYRQNHYKPTNVFKGSISLLLQIPFFIAAYQFLSHLELLNGASFGVLSDLGSEDGLIKIGGLHINLLPIIMTAINVVSSILYTKGYPTKTKIQLYFMAAFFLIFLYKSPAGLVFYWTLNNTFSLGKTIYYKLRNKISNSEKKRSHKPKKPSKLKADSRTFFAGAVYLAALVGGLIPALVMSVSPQEFVDLNNYMHPLWFLCSSLCYSVGTFVVWFGVFYWLTAKEHRQYFELVIWILCGVTTLDFMCFGKELGLINNTLKFEVKISYSVGQKLINLGAVLLLGIVLFLIFRFGRKFVTQALLTLNFALVVLFAANVVLICDSVTGLREMSEEVQANKPSYTLSKGGKNVVVLMLDRAMGEYIPYFINEKPELKETFSGFTYYPNVVSFGGATNFASPAVFGGYEYTPEKINLRDTETLCEKQNEALKVMPVLFDQNDYDVTVCDPSYANYQWIPDISIYDEYPNIDAYITTGKFNDDNRRLIVLNKRNFFLYGLMKVSPLCIQMGLYDNGNYNFGGDRVYAAQVIHDNYTATGTSEYFKNTYSVLDNLPEMSEIDEGDTNTFLMMVNCTTHEPMLLQEPEYVPSDHVDNTAYEETHADRFTVDGVTLRMETEEQWVHYQTNMAALLKVGEWLEYLKENDLYNNTRIIIVSDHGNTLDHVDQRVNGEKNYRYNIERYRPVLLVKDFNSETFSVSDEFMTNGDVATLATSDIIDNPVNPFTGNVINNDEKTAHDQYIFGSDDWDTAVNNGNTFFPGPWLSVHDNIFDMSNWTILTDDAVLPY